MFEQLEELEEKPQQQQETDWSGTIIGSALFPVLFIFDHFGKFEMGLNVSICVAMNILVIRFRWNLRKHFWFWATMVLLTAAELPLIYKIRWPHHWVPGVSLLPVGLAAVLIAFAVVRFVQTFVVRDPSLDDGG
jgi:hypothetical protein